MSDSVYVDLSPVIRSIENVAQVLGRNIAVVDGKVEVLVEETEATKNKLDSLYTEFSAFVIADRKAKELQKALTEIVRVRQELDKKYGHYDEVRRTTLGILQATDAGLVRQGTILSITEELMLNSPRYWLAPALVALSAWLKDDRELAERALSTALSRDDYKTSLFFSLVCRRASRGDATTRWLTRYFQMQNPMNMDREVVVMLDGLANGVFGGAALASCSTVVEEWLKELELQVGFLEEQRKRWATKLDVMAPGFRQEDYPTLFANSPTADALRRSLSAARRNQVTLDFFNALFTGEIMVPPTLEQAVDEILESLVKNFDDEELPLRKEERLYQLVKEENGDLDPARQRLSAEYEVFEEKTSFAALLTNSAMSPEEFGATRATQRYAVSRSRDWIIAAQNDLTVRDRLVIPSHAEIKAGSWLGKSENGGNEQQLVTDLEKHYAKRLENALLEIKITPGTWIVSVVAGLIGFVTLFSGNVLMGLILAGGAGGFLYWKHQEVEKAKDTTRQNFQKETGQAKALLRACLAELTDYRRELEREDSKTSAVVEFLNDLASPQFVLQRRDQPRATMAS
jgi:hypothetical protein